MSKLFDQIIADTPKDIDYFVDLSFDIADQIHAVLDEQGLSQKDLAKALGKQESEISKWLSGTHNFTLKTISKISAVLDTEIIEVKNSFRVPFPIPVSLDSEWIGIPLERIGMPLEMLEVATPEPIELEEDLAIAA